LTWIREEILDEVVVLLFEMIEVFVFLLELVFEGQKG
jgi:hypothetical protein